MGWLFYHREKGESNLDHFRRELGVGDRLIDGATKNGVFYGALRVGGDASSYKTASGKEEVTALVVLLRWNRGEYNFGYKDMDEAMGPGYAECPEKILKLLSPVEAIYGEAGETGSARYATDWREECYAAIRKRKESAKVKPGMTVKFAEAVKFTSGAELDTLTFEKRDTFRDEYGRRYRVSGWRNRRYELVAA